MKKTLSIISLALIALAAVPVWAHSASTSLTISARVDQFAEWADPTGVIFEADWSGAIDHINQSRTVSRPIVLYTNTDAIISAKPGLNNGILTMGSEILKTAYKVTGSVTTPDISFKAASGEFFSPVNTYMIARQQGTGAYVINLEVQMSSPTASAPEHGVYACGVVLTAEW